MILQENFISLMDNSGGHVSTKVNVWITYLINSCSFFTEKGYRKHSKLTTKLSLKIEIELLGSERDKKEAVSKEVTLYRQEELPVYSETFLSC